MARVRNYSVTSTAVLSVDYRDNFHLQLSLPRTSTKDSNGQDIACVERCCAYRQRHLEVWPRSGSDTARRTSLARCPQPGVFQAGSDSSPVSERPRTAVPDGLLRSGRRCRHWAAPAFRQPSSQLLALPRYRLNTYGRRAFWVAGPKVWNSLQDFIRDPTISADSFRRLLKTYLFARY